MPPGSAPGERRGGRQKGTPNKATVARRLLARRGLAAVQHTGKLPLEIMLAVAAGGREAERITDRQLQAAVAAAPYIHPRLTAVAVRDVTPPDPAVEERRRQARAEMHRVLAELAKPEPLTSEDAKKMLDLDKFLHPLENWPE